MTVSRPMLWISASFLAGMYLLAFFDATVACAVLFCIFITAVIYICRFRKAFECVVVFLAVIAFICGTVVYGLYDDVRTKKLYPYIRQPLMIQCEVTEQATVEKTYLRLKARTEQIVLQNGTTVSVQEPFLLTCFINSKAPTKIPVPKRGDVVSVLAELSLPESAKNIGGFDYASYLKTEGVFFQATGQSNTLQVTGHVSHPVFDIIYGVREKCASIFDSMFPEQVGGVLKAYILGDDTDMDDETNAIFSASGLTHVLAVSGAHVVVFLSIIMMFLAKIHVPKRWQLFLSAFLIVVYVIFTGMSVSAVRAGFVCFTAVLAQILFRRSDPVTALFEAGAFLAIWNPASVCGASFMLSFAATLGILLFGNLLSRKLSFIYTLFEKGTKRRKIMRGICDGLAIGFSAQIFTIPVLIGLFQVFSTLSVIATIILTPLLSPLLAGGLLFCVVGSINSVAALPVAGFIYLLTKMMILVAKLFASVPLSQISYGGITPFFLLVYSIAVTLLFAIVKRKRVVTLTCLYALASLSVIYLCHVFISDSVSNVSFINVGQGDCAWINAPGNCDILIDAGGKDGDYGIAEETVWPYLLKHGVRDIEYAVASHGHSDHINGLVGLLSLTKVKNLIIPFSFGETDEAKVLLERAEEKNVNIIRMQCGDRMEFENGLILSALAPDHKMVKFLSKDENDLSLLLKVEYGENAFLFTGDQSEEGEGYMTSLHSEMLRSTVVKAAHHGSKTANSDLFLDATSPEFIYIPVGENSYGHPDRTVLKRIYDRNIFCYRADQHGDVTFYMDKSRVRGVHFRLREIIGG